MRVCNNNIVSINGWQAKVDSSSFEGRTEICEIFLSEHDNGQLINYLLNRDSDAPLDVLINNRMHTCLEDMKIWQEAGPVDAEAGLLYWFSIEEDAAL